mmetsp:Transcript_28584/g.60960  ORF Transcript_28584/g.60960 Transcript_28584/m.60960 type:complete len:221 (+) Transcript_28584:187-849(+)|eukprot:CAMPEP_0172313232 /NCGR_PEP_ID=MMETSP1058-20130122/19744_1 /TAXON_ID=83371 /ORGANISM="Detonula confervacea, Strain CCMP 353" /LENGTH=220 /DNA_ID=CAMNT_0013026849 /DNA_START=140 /DNA_END=802 /DNA_ORIENTATION=+
MPRVFSSVREAWNGVLSGAVPTTRRRASCSIVDAPHSSSDRGSGLPQAETQATAADTKEEEEPFECCDALVRLSNDESNRKEIDIDTLSDDDLRRLKKDDPFLYYSIPSIRRRSYMFDDDGDDDDDIRAAVRSSRRSSLPAKVLANADISRWSHQQQQARQEIEEPRRRRESVVKRSRRLSTEAHPSLICDELLRELQELDVGSDVDDDLEILERELGWL